MSIASCAAYFAVSAPQTCRRARSTMKIVNIVLMVLMGLLAIREGIDIVQHGANSWNVIFCLLFGAFAVRRFMLMSKYSTAK